MSIGVYLFFLVLAIVGVLLAIVSLRNPQYAKLKWPHTEVEVLDYESYISKVKWDGVTQFGYRFKYKYTIEERTYFGSYTREGLYGNELGIGYRVGHKMRVRYNPSKVEELDFTNDVDYLVLPGCGIILTIIGIVALLLATIATITSCFARNELRENGVEIKWYF